MVKGYADKVLHVDLTTSEIWVEEPPASFYRRYLGGEGFVAYYLLKEVPRGADPLGPENRLIFANGTYTGIPFAGSGRSSVGAKSPVSGGFGEGEAGGFWGAELKHAGFDAIVISGIAPKPVYLWIHNGEAELRPADHLWGKPTLETRLAIIEELGDKNIRAAMIGPGGEKMVSFACVMHDLKHSAGRTGTGAVMGSKNLKAVAVRGTHRTEVANPDQVKALAGYMRDHWEDTSKNMGTYGTAGGVNSLNAAGVLPTNNFGSGQFEGHEKISGEAMVETILVQTDGCFACPIHCKRVVKVDEEGMQVDPIYGGPEYETIGAFGSLCGVDDLKAISKANELCNAYSLDTISAGGMVAFAMECFENGILTLEDTGGLDLRFGNAQAMVELTRQICEREGLGKLLGDGPAAAVAKFGPAAAGYVMAVKNQYFPMHEGRARHGQALGYAVSPTGADHMHNVWDDSFAGDRIGEGQFELGIYEPMLASELGANKVRAFMYLSNWVTLHNHLGNCMFIPWTRQQIVELVEGVTGWRTNVWELLKTSERIVTMARAFNLREGLTRDDDCLPDRMTESLPTHAGVSKQELQEALTLYYGMMGWDPDSGVPTKGKLLELDIAWVDEAMAGLRQ
jgi:aldehyde:ferredoxin oxidoreductase